MHIFHPILLMVAPIFENPATCESGTLTQGQYIAAKFESLASPLVTAAPNVEAYGTGSMIVKQSPLSSHTS